MSHGDGGGFHRLIAVVAAQQKRDEARACVLGAERDIAMAGEDLLDEARPVGERDRLGGIAAPGEEVAAGLDVEQLDVRVERWLEAGVDAGLGGSEDRARLVQARLAEVELVATAGRHLERVTQPEGTSHTHSIGRLICEEAKHRHVARELQRRRLGLGGVERLLRRNADELNC